jgi:AAA ATPase domain
MPFVRKNDSQKPQPSTSTQNIFIGRNNELTFFSENILKPEYPAYNIVSISGMGGVGKSTLLSRFIDEAHASGFRDYCLTALVDERQTTPASIMEEFADQLRNTGHPLSKFEDALTRYKTALRKLQIERETAREALLQKAATDLTGSMVKSVPVVGSFLEKGTGLAIEYILDEHRYRQQLKDAERLENPVEDLTIAFVEELNNLTDTLVVLNSSSRLKRHYRVILLFDTFEQLASEAAPWLLDYFLHADINDNVILVIAGRDSIEYSIPNDPKRWLKYRDEHIIYSLPLESLTEDQTREYLAMRGITEDERIAAIWQLSKGLPLYLSFLTSDPRAEFDPTANVVANFLHWIPEQEKIKRRLAQEAALFSRPFNQDDLEAFTFVSENERPALYLWLIGQPFVQPSALNGRYTYHNLAQELFSRLFSTASRETRVRRWYRGLSVR